MITVYDHFVVILDIFRIFQARWKNLKILVFGRGCTGGLVNPSRCLRLKGSGILSGVDMGLEFLSFFSTM
jgi:hypothetical protein